MKRIAVETQMGGAPVIPADIAARAFASMLPRRVPGGLAAHPAIWRLIDAAGGQPLHAVHRQALKRLGASHDHLNYLNSVILNSRPIRSIQ